MISEQEKDIAKWYVVGTTSVHQELRIRDDLRKAGMESYVPLAYEIKRTKDRHERRLVPIISGLVFVHTSYNLFWQYAFASSDRIYLRKSSFSNNEDYLTVSNHDMRRFIDITTAFLKEVTYFKPGELTVHEGELVEIQLGTRSYQAEVKRIKGKRGKRLVVEVPGVTMAAITVTPELMKNITHLSDIGQEKRRQQRKREREKKLQLSGKSDQRKVRNLELDKKEATAIAYHLLFEVCPNHVEDAENRIAQIELQRLRNRLAGIKGIIASQEGELALAMFLSGRALRINDESDNQRLQRAIEQQKDSSILKMRLRFFQARLNGDHSTLSTIRKEVKTWNKLHLSDRQRTFWNETLQGQLFD